jgi:endonuclease III
MKPRTTSRQIIDRGHARRLIRRVERELRAKYGAPTLGNKKNLVSELVYIILSARTAKPGYVRAYNALRRRFGSWEAVRDATRSEVGSILRPAGLSRTKTAQIQGALKRISKDFGTLSGRPLKRLPDRALERYLSGLPGVGLKTARCVMMYAADRQVFPADTHCIRLFYNLGLLRSRPRMEDAQDLLQQLVPPAIRKSLHVAAVAHGQLTCVPNRPRCERCPIRELCCHAKRS